MLALRRYVHLSPVFVRAMRRESVKSRVPFLRRYPRSSYLSRIGKAEREESIDSKRVLQGPRGGISTQRREYRRFVESVIEDADAAFVEDKRASLPCIGASGRGR